MAQPTHRLLFALLGTCAALVHVSAQVPRRHAAPGTPSLPMMHTNGVGAFPRPHYAIAGGWGYGPGRGPTQNVPCAGASAWLQPSQAGLPPAMVVFSP